MTWTQQRLLVSSLSLQGLERKREAKQLRADLKNWMSGNIGSPEVLAWMFAAGSWWAAGPSGTVAKGGKRRSAMAAINTALLAWQLMNREFRSPPTTADNAFETRR